MARYALVIGIGSNIAPLKTLSKTVGDATAIADLLKRQGDFTEVKRLIGEVTQTQLEGALQTLLQQQAERNEVVIYYTGHGFPVVESFGSRRAYLAPSDCEIQVKEEQVVGQKRGIPLDGLNGLIGDANLSNLVVLLECCYGGALLESRLVQKTMTAFSRKDYFLVAACREFEKAYALREANHSIFTSALLRGLTEEKNDRGQITTGRLFDFISNKLKGSGQEPICLGGGRSLTLVTYPITTPAPETPQEIPTSQPADSSPWYKQQRTIFVAAFALVAAVVMGLVAIPLVSKPRQDPIDVLKGSDLEKIAEQMPAIKQEIDKERQKVDTLPERSDSKMAIADYNARKKQIDNFLILHQLFLQKVADLRERGNLNAENSALAKEVEDSLALMIHKYRIPFLAVDLQQLQFGKLNEKSHFGDSPDKQFTPGALRTTYEIVMTESGANADLDRNGIIKSPDSSNPKEANQLPCRTLKEIEDLWKKATDQKCGWYKKGSGKPHVDPECEKELAKYHPSATTLAMMISGLNPDQLVDRVKNCEKSAP